MGFRNLQEKLENKYDMNYIGGIQCLRRREEVGRWSKKCPFLFRFVLIFFLAIYFSDGNSHSLSEFQSELKRCPIPLKE